MAGMRRRACDDPVQVEFRNETMSRFRWAERDFEVVALLKMIAVRDPRGGVESQLWHVGALSGDARAATYEIHCDHGAWRLAAIWEGGNPWW